MCIILQQKSMGIAKKKMHKLCLIQNDVKDASNGSVQRSYSPAIIYYVMGYDIMLDILLIYGVH